MLPELYHVHLCWGPYAAKVAYECHFSSMSSQSISRTLIPRTEVGFRTFMLKQPVAEERSSDASQIALGLSMHNVRIALTGQPKGLEARHPLTAFSLSAILNL